MRCEASRRSRSHKLRTALSMRPIPLLLVSPLYNHTFLSLLTGGTLWAKASMGHQESSLPAWAKAYSQILGNSGATIVTNRFRDYQQAVEFVRACHVVPEPKEPVFTQGEGPPDESSNWT